MTPPDRDARLAAALRSNLRRRKAQTRVRETEREETGGNGAGGPAESAGEAPVRAAASPTDDDPETPDS